MIIHDNICFHHVVGLEPVQGMPGLQLQRFPQPVRQALNPHARWVSEYTNGAELRFVCEEAAHLRLFLSVLEEERSAVVFRGDILHSVVPLEPGKQLCLHLQPPARLNDVDPDAWKGQRFPPSLWRVLLPPLHVVYHRLQTFGHPVRPPTPSEQPDIRLLAYGSSLTEGALAGRVDGHYVQHLARRLGADVLNYGMGGSCWLEPEIADFFAHDLEWDIALLELGINMLGRFDGDAFRERATYFVETLHNAHPERPLVLVTPFPHFSDFAPAEAAQRRRKEEFSAILRELAARHALLLIEGREMMPDIGGMTIDMVHPSDYGHMLIGQNLAEALQPVLLRLRSSKET